MQMKPQAIDCFEVLLEEMFIFYIAASLLLSSEGKQDRTSNEICKMNRGSISTHQLWRISLQSAQRYARVLCFQSSGKEAF